MITAKVKIQGIKPMFWHAFGPDAIPLEKQEKTGVAGNDPEEWRRTCLVTKDGQLYIEPSYVFGCLVSGAKYTRKGKGSIQKTVAASLQVMDNRILIDRWWPDYPNGKDFSPQIAVPPPQDHDLPLYLDIRGVINPSTRGRNVRYRIASSPGWICEFTLLWDPTIVSRGEMEAVLIDAGKLVGLGNGRAIGMGRFEVVSFDVNE